MLLSEYIGAEIISYVDCKAFQIVCPSCKEPVFKVVRDTIPESIHYLSHYNKDVSYDADCELRVSHLSNEEIEEANNFSRGQRLEYFLRVLQKAILETVYPDVAEQNNAEEFAKKVRRSKGLKKFREHWLSEDRKIYASLTEKEIEEFFNGYIDDVIEISGDFPPTTFSLTTQKKIAQDIWRHLLSAKAKDNYMFLYSHAYISLIVRIQLAQKERAVFDYERNIHTAMIRLLQAHAKEGDEILRSLARLPIGPPHAIAGSNLLRKMGSEIEHEMLGLLLHLPYFEMIKEAKADAVLTNEV